MTRALKEFRLNDRTARAKLQPREKPYWRLVSEGRHIGYRAGKTSGSWVARYREAGSGEDYIIEKIGVADDRVEADGVRILSWKQATEKADAWFAERTGIPRNAPSLPTVREALQAYIKIRDARDSARRGRPMRSTASSRLTRHVLDDPMLPPITLDRLTETDLKIWLGGVKLTKATTKRRLCADLKAALNQAYAAHRKRLPADLVGAIKEGLRVETEDDGTPVSTARENQILSDDAIRLLVEAAYRVDEDGDLGRLVLLLAATGARFSQVQRILVRDVQTEQSRILIPSSRKGKGQKPEHYRVQVGADVLDALAPILQDRRPEAVLLERWQYVRAGRGQWKRDRRAPWIAAYEMTKVWKAVRTEAKLTGVVPYALRHSSIVRGLRVGLPIRLVAALHDTSVEMIERHYARWIIDGLEELGARAVIPLKAEPERQNIARQRRKRSGSDLDVDRAALRAAGKSARPIEHGA